MHALMLSLISVLLITQVAPARADAVEEALNDAIAAFDMARPALDAEVFGVDVVAYADALSLGRFTSSHWAGEVALALEEARDAEAACARYAAFVDLPPQNGTVTLVICPQFSREGTRALRRLTILHEMVHVVAGADECRAMAFAARVEQLATGAFTSVERYWRANGCPNSGFGLP